MVGIRRFGVKGAAESAKSVGDAKALDFGKVLEGSFSGGILSLWLWIKQNNHPSLLKGGDVNFVCFVI